MEGRLRSPVPAGRTIRARACAIISTGTYHGRQKALCQARHALHIARNVTAPRTRHPPLCHDRRRRSASEGRTDTAGRL